MYAMLHTKFQGNRFIDSGEEFLKVFTKNGYGGHVDHVAQTV